jgi:hypothetical protein
MTSSCLWTPSHDIAILSANLLQYDVHFLIRFPSEHSCTKDLVLELFLNHYTQSAPQSPVEPVTEVLGLGYSYGAFLFRPEIRQD